MSGTIGILSLVPPVVAVALALWKRQLIPSLFLGIWIGHAILNKGRVFPAFFATLDNSIRIASVKSNLEIILFCFLIGSFLALIRESNGFQGIIEWFERRKAFKGRAAVFPLTFLIGVSIFVESWSSMLIDGAVMRPLYIKLRIAQEKLAYFLHSISLNFVAMVVINSWGAYYISLLMSQNIPSPLKVIVKSIPYNYYCLTSLAMVIVVMATSLSLGPMRRAERQTAADGESARPGNGGLEGEIRARGKQLPPKAFNMILPTVVLVAGVFWGLYYTGGGAIYKGSGSAAVFYAGVVSILVTSAYYFLRRYFRLAELMEIIYKGAGDLFSIGALLVFALTMGDLCKQMGTGVFLADLVKNSVPVFLLPAIIFLTSCVISFSTGTAYGTLAIMVPIAMPMAGLMGIPFPLMFGACVSGGVFGNNCSPISDTSIIASLAAGVPVLRHVKTQLPYALISAGVATALFLLTGLLR
jgi:tetracycline resistance efflux pump